MFKKGFTIIFIMMIIAGCGASKKEVSPITSEEQMILLTDLDQRVKQLKKSTNESLKDNEEELNQIRERLTNIEGNVSEINANIDTLYRRIGSSPQTPVYAQEKTYAAQSSSEQKYPPKTVLPHTAQMKKEYMQAWNYYDSRQYLQAIESFSTLLSQYPNTDLSDNCQYWIGESFYGLHEYEKALEAFHRVLLYPDSNKQDHAVFMQGKIYDRLDMRDKAITCFRKVLNEYPDSNRRTNAKHNLNKLM